MNESHKIKSLYKNLEYSLIQTIAYHSILCKIHSTSITPEDLKIKILTLNNLDSFIETKNEKILSSLNSKLNDFFEDIQDYLVSQYISTIKSHINTKIYFNSKIIALIEEALDSEKSLFENEYMSIIKSYIQNPFIEQYRKILIKEKK